jgi:hypothetical protein
MKTPARFLKVALAVVTLAALAGVPALSAFAARPAATSPTLGNAASFAVLAGAAVTNVPISAITGDVGLSPAAGTNYAGLTPVQVSGTIYAVDATGPAGIAGNNPGLVNGAKTDLITAYDALSAGGNAACTVNYGAVVKDLVGLTLVPGVYCADAFALSGTLTLDDTGNANGVWIFRSELSTLITSAGGVARVRFLTGVASSCNVWWKVASSATLNTGTAFMGNVLALTSISMKTGASLAGRALARNAAVTLESNTISNICAAVPPPSRTPAPPEVPEASSFLLMASGLGGLATWLGWQRAKRGRAAKP